MPSLVWEKPVADAEMSEHPSLTLQLKLRLVADERENLARALAALHEPGAGELRLRVSDAWTLFWKLRDGESRALLAHPEHSLWVATLALLPADLERLVARLASPLAAPVVLSDVCELGGVSNFELVLHGE